MVKHEPRKSSDGFVDEQTLTLNVKTMHILLSAINIFEFNYFKLWDGKKILDKLELIYTNISSERYQNWHFGK